MPVPAANVLLTGKPGCGKTTLVRRVLEHLGGRRLAGFYTGEIRRGGRRLGFAAIGLNGGSTVLAHVDHDSVNRVGRYGVDLRGFDPLVARELGRRAGDVDLFVIDEIGRMECCSALFVQWTRAVLDGAVPVLATIAVTGGGFMAEVRSRPDVELVTVSAANRAGLAATLADRLTTRPAI
ncbi:MAG: nucleoside-triphosphatase [Planctomycetota bacterium]|jgi:nucleoside-triphosphatase